MHATIIMAKGSITTNFVLNSLIRFTLKMEATRSSEASVVTRAPRSHIPQDGILRPEVCLYVY
jgi:hypothetical protein